MPRGKKTVEEPSGDATPVKELLEALEADRKRQQEQEKKRSEEHRELMGVLVGFERVATAYKWPDEMWKLVPLLTGRALAAYANMDQEAAKDYGNVKKAILRRFDINKETYRQRFRTMKKAETQLHSWAYI
uniref:Uncharacterized protein n=1 Tax=Amphimedon queenslandica TaxID=400682 RepID=A0A1X7UPP9_AMPQE